MFLQSQNHTIEKAFLSCNLLQMLCKLPINFMPTVQENSLIWRNGGGGIDIQLIFFHKTSLHFSRIFVANLPLTLWPYNWEGSLEGYSYIYKIVFLDTKIGRVKGKELWRKDMMIGSFIIVLFWLFLGNRRSVGLFKKKKNGSRKMIEFISLSWPLLQFILWTQNKPV